MVTTRVPTGLGELRLSLYRCDGNDQEHLALVRGEVLGRPEVLVRLHSECFTGDVLSSRRCDCGGQLFKALEEIDREACGVVVYLRQEGRGIGLLEKLKAYNLQDLGYDTVDANRLLGHAPDERDYALAAAILTDLGVRSIRLLTNNPAKIEGLRENGVEVRERIPMLTPVTAENAAYLRTKAIRLQHLLDLDALAVPSRDLAERPEEVAVALQAIEDGVGSAGRPALASKNGPGGAGGEAVRRPDLPFVTLSYAQSVDGSIAARKGEPLALSGPESLALTHELRAAHEAILVGIGTVLADDPLLTVRLVEARDPQPVVLDSRLRFPLGARMLERSRPWIAAAEDADPERQERLERAGARVLRLPTTAQGRLSLEHLLRALGELGIGSLMVEGGSRVITSFLAERRVDHLVLTVAPTLVGGLAAVGAFQDGERPPLPRLRNPRYQRLGDDLIVRAEPEWAES
ncbi:MAG TPA: GTP cyclohydrolase II [Thermoanaerobaculia bacterium]|nr:GTP cyclohydrolase II [Thermoanaerobaculia bacterium]